MYLRIMLHCLTIYNYIHLQNKLRLSLFVINNCSRLSFLKLVRKKPAQRLSCDENRPKQKNKTFNKWVKNIPKKQKNKQKK